MIQHTSEESISEMFFISLISKTYIFVLSEVWDTEEILISQEELNLKPSVSQRFLCLVLATRRKSLLSNYLAQDSPSFIFSLMKLILLRRCYRAPYKRKFTASVFNSVFIIRPTVRPKIENFGK